MRIAYLYERNDAHGSGVFNKIISQSREWAANGHEIALFNLSGKDTAQAWRDKLPPEIAFQQIVWSSALDRLRAMDSLIQRVCAWKPTLIYTRHGLYYPSYERIIGKIPVVIEVNSDELNEARLRSAGAYWYRRLTRGRMLSHAAGLVFISHELSENPRFATFARPHVVVPNGIDLQRFTPQPPSGNTQPHLFFIGHPHTIFHGLDKIAALARHFTDWHFDIVGPGPDEFEAPLPPNLVVHGLLAQDAYLPLVQRADVAIGTLAMHRKGLHEASPLKLAEYLAYGLPTIIGCKYTNFTQPVDFILELPNTDTNIMDNLDRIGKFVTAHMGKRIPRELIQQVDIRHYEAKRLSFMSSLL